MAVDVHLPLAIGHWPLDMIGQYTTAILVPGMKYEIRGGQVPQDTGHRTDVECRMAVAAHSQDMTTKNKIPGTRCKYPRYKYKNEDTRFGIRYPIAVIMHRHVGAWGASVPRCLGASFGKVLVPGTSMDNTSMLVPGTTNLIFCPCLIKMRVMDYIRDQY